MSLSIVAVNAGHCDLEVSFGDFLIDGVCAPESAAADAEQHVYVEDLDCVNHFAHILVTVEACREMFRLRGESR